MKTAQYGFYSKAAARNHGSYFWSTPDGRIVEVTQVDSSQDGNDYKFDDKKCVGEVVNFVRAGARPAFSCPEHLSESPGPIWREME